MFITQHFDTCKHFSIEFKGKTLKCMSVHYTKAYFCLTKLLWYKQDQVCILHFLHTDQLGIKRVSDTCEIEFQFVLPVVFLSKSCCTVGVPVALRVFIFISQDSIENLFLQRTVIIGLNYQ